jgi:hypothetical protein
VLLGACSGGGQALFKDTTGAGSSASGGACVDAGPSTCAPASCLYDPGWVKGSWVRTGCGECTDSAAACDAACSANTPAIVLKSDALVYTPELQSQGAECTNRCGCEGLWWSVRLQLPSSSWCAAIDGPAGATIRKENGDSCSKAPSDDGCAYLKGNASDVIVLGLSKPTPQSLFRVRLASSGCEMPTCNGSCSGTES